jgi:probable F420-dependent oxidoreductase
MIELAGARADGAHTYFVPPEHTARAREILGAQAFLAPEHKAVLSTDAEQARAAGRKMLDIYLGLQNYRNNWKRLGFSDADLAKPGSDALVEAVIAHGSAEQVAARLHEHLRAGADHVPVQVLTRGDKLVAALAELAGPLGLTTGAA